jgi:hypothetical protein
VLAVWLGLGFQGCAGGGRPVARSSGASASEAAPRLDTSLALVEGGDRAFAQRQDALQIERAIGAYRDAASLKESFEIRMRLARAEHFAALVSAGETRLGHLTRCAQEALRGLALAGVSSDDPCAAEAPAQSVAAVYWRAECLDGQAKEVGLVASASERRTALCLARRAADLDPRFEHAGPLRLLGRLLAQTPALIGGDLQASREAFERAQGIAPDFLFNRVDLAATWALKSQDRTAFDEAVQSALRASEGEPEVAPENRLARERARQLAAAARALFR